MLLPLPPPVMPMSVCAASPGPFTTQPIIDKEIGVFICDNLSSNSLTVLGLIGTVLGFIIALSGVDPDVASNPSAISPMVAQLIEGMSVALYTTLVGSILSVWLGLIYQMLATGTSNLVSQIIELSER